MANCKKSASKKGANVEKKKPSIGNAKPNAMVVDGKVVKVKSK